MATCTILFHNSSDKPFFKSSRVIFSLNNPKTIPALKLSPAPMVLLGVIVFAEKLSSTPLEKSFAPCSPCV